MQQLNTTKTSLDGKNATCQKISYLSACYY